MRLMFLAPVLVAVSVACGGGDNDRMLHLREFDITESDYRTLLRVEFAQDPMGANTLCASLRGLSSQEIVSFMRALPVEESDGIPAAAQPAPGQVPDDASLERLAVLLREECSRMFS